MMRFAAILLGSAVLTCTPRTTDTSSPPAGFEHAYAAPDCAPWDGYAVSLVLRHTPLPPRATEIEMGDDQQLRLAIYPRDSRGAGPSGIRPGTVQWPAEPQVAGGSLCENDRCTPIPRGVITIRDADASGNFGGTVALALPDKRVVEGTFRAEWRQRARLCG
jgi:hypothetical protein